MTGPCWRGAPPVWAGEHEVCLATSAPDITALSRPPRGIDAGDRHGTAHARRRRRARGSGAEADLSIRSIGEGHERRRQARRLDALRRIEKRRERHPRRVASSRGLVIKYRLDGTLTQVGAVEGSALAEQVLSRLKVMSELDIAERRVPQDGRFRIRAFGRDIDFRVSIMPSIHGEDAVVRVLDKQSLADQVSGLRLDVLGFDEQTLVAFRRMTRDPYGLLLVTGPTGSGKTTTLYAAISEINRGQDKIITIEDPVEYQLAGVLQIPVNEKKGLTFARGLRSILRHDPDRIMVGEIRDPETAQIAIQAALTGHLVLSTVHANNVFDVIGRFTHMEVDPYSFVSALTGVLAQRLVRLGCIHCAEPCMPTAEAMRLAGIASERAEGRRAEGRPRLRPLQRHRLQGAACNWRVADARRRPARGDRGARPGAPDQGARASQRHAFPSRRGRSTCSCRARRPSTRSTVSRWFPERLTLDIGDGPGASTPDGDAPVAERAHRPARAAPRGAGHVRHRRRRGPLPHRSVERRAVEPLRSAGPSPPTPSRTPTATRHVRGRCASTPPATAAPRSPRRSMPRCSVRSKRSAASAACSWQACSPRSCTDSTAIAPTSKTVVAWFVWIESHWVTALLRSRHEALHVRQLAASRVDVARAARSGMVRARARRPALPCLRRALGRRDDTQGRRGSQ